MPDKVLEVCDVFDDRANMLIRYYCNKCFDEYEIQKDIPVTEFDKKILGDKLEKYIEQIKR